MEDLKFVQNSYPYSENFRLNHQVNSIGLSYCFPTQTIPGDPYFPGINNQSTGQSRKEDARNAYTTFNEFTHWDDNSLRTNNLSISKFEQNLYASRETFLFQSSHSVIDGDKKNDFSRKIHNQYSPSNLSITSDNSLCAENKKGKKTSFIGETMFYKCHDIHKDSRSQTYKKCMFESSFSNNISLDNESSNMKEFEESKCELPINSNYEYCDDYTGLGNFFGLTSTPNNSELDIPDQQTEYSNGGSDIIVEESEEENNSEVQESLSHIYKKCVVCNLIFVPQGDQFYYLTSNNPVTMTSQQPVFLLLKNLVGSIRTENNYICCECLGLLNRIDHSQSQLDNYKVELQCKFRKTDNYAKTRKTFFGKSKQTRCFPYYRCKYCKKTLSFKNFCRYHIMQHKNMNLLCEKCGVLCRSNKMFHKHICIYSKTSEPLVMQPLTCTNCNKFFRTKVHLREHQNSCLLILPYICKIMDCGKKFATSTRLRNHGKLKHDKKFVAICSICNIGFIKISDYKSHKVIHSNDKKFQCQKCLKNYKTLSNLNFHLKTHKQSLPFLCGICGKGFMRKEYLETHINNHKGIKNFLCTICSKKFASQKNLDSHFKYHDDSIKKKVCSICGKSLTSMNEHMRIHINSREYECNKCDMKFNTRGTLQKHKKCKHNNTSSVC